jgi:hypothetical protein
MNNISERIEESGGFNVRKLSSELVYHKVTDKPWYSVSEKVKAPVIDSRVNIVHSTSICV